MKLIPASIAAPTMRSASSCWRRPILPHMPSSPPPKVMVPRQRSETKRPVRPSGLSFNEFSSACAERSVLEQVLVLARLRAPVLVRRRDASAEPGGGVPRPARVVKHRAGERDSVGLAAGDDRLGLLGLGDQADGDRRQANLGLDALRERHLVAGPELDRLLRRDAA